VPAPIRMPSLGQTSAEHRIVAWLKAEGDAVQLGEPLLEVETDKATLEVEAFTAGTLLKIVRAADEVVEAGTLLAYIGTPGEAVPAHDPSPAKRDTPAVPHQAARITSPSPQASRSSPSPPAPPPGRVMASPAARQLAREHGIDLARVQGRGPGGRIETTDVLELIEKAGGPGEG
jgi:pyruvate/2-oxoglutarate dehydrogenase complex dihydrolipoamide acyltransferase (E2) component